MYARQKKFFSFAVFFAEFLLTFHKKSCKIFVDCKGYVLYILLKKEATVVKNQTYRMTMLYDFYGELLTERQKEFYDLYYNNDLSLSEIAENFGISRQGVRDVIVRAEGILTDIEDKTGLVKRFLRMSEHLDAITAAAKELSQINYRQYEDHRVDELTKAILTETDALKE